MLNLSFITASGDSRYELKNIFNQLGRDRYTSRLGINSQSDNFSSAEYYYLSRTTYNGQFTGKHALNASDMNLDWSAGYASINLPLGNLNVYAGVRFEHNKMELIRNSRDTERSEYSTYYPTNDFFPSVNLSYSFNPLHKLRLAYGRSINRPGMGITGSDANKIYQDVLYDATGKQVIDASKPSYSSSFFLAQSGNRSLNDTASLLLTDAGNLGAAFMPMAGSELLSAASFADALLSGTTPVSYIGAFAANDNWMNGWTNFNPNDTDY